MSATDEKHGPGGHEQRDFNLKYVALTIAGLAALTLAGMLVSWWAFRVMEERRQAAAAPPAPLAVTRPALPPEPRLQVYPRADIDELRRAEDERLSSYGWVDREAGVVRVPIERAMEMVLERGLPVRQEEVGNKK